MPQASFSILPLADSDSLPLRQHILALTEPQGATPDQAALYGLVSEPVYLSAVQARQLLCLNEWGESVRQNATGNSVVSRIGEVFYKLNPAAPGLEYAVHTVHQGLAADLSPPTLLLAIRYGNAFYTVQASLAVTGIGLEELLWLAPTLQRLQTLLGEAQLLAQLPAWLHDKHIAAFSQRYPQYADEKLDAAAHYQALRDWLERTPADYHPLEFADWTRLDATQRQQLFAELPVQRALRGYPMLPLVALLEQYPKLAQEMHLVELVRMASIFKTLALVFPGAAPEVMLAEAPRLLEKLDAENFSAHVLATLLTQPQDGKADNYIAQLTRDATGQIMKIRLVSIDNDAAFVQPIIILPGQTAHEVDMRAIIYALAAPLQQPMAKAVTERFLQYSPPVWLLRWLTGLYHYQSVYQSLSQQCLLPAALTTQILRPQEIVLLLERVTAIQTLLRTQPALSLQALLNQQEPLIARVYQAISVQQQHDPLAVMAAFYAKRPPLLVETLLAAQLDEPLTTAYPLTVRQALALEIYGPTHDEQRTAALIEAIHYSVARISLTLLTADDQLALWQAIGQLAQCQLVLPLRQPYWIDDTVLAALYAQQPAAALAVVKNYPQLQLRLAKKETIKLALTDPLLLHHILPAAQYQPALLQALLAAGAQVNGRNPTNGGYTPLHLAARYNFHALIPLLINNGAELEAKLDPQAQAATPLDKAIQYHHLQASRDLIQQGAGRALQLANGLAFLHTYATTELALCQQLLCNCPALAWQASLLALTQSEAPWDFRKRLAIAGLEKDKVRYLTRAAYDQLFKDRTTITKDNCFGRHAVTQITTQAYGLPFSVHIKENPELPGREVMVSTLAEQLFGQGAPQVALFGLTKEQGMIFKDRITYPVLASRTVGSGKEQQDNLANVLVHTPERLQQLDAQSFSEAIILAMLTNPEDGKADNYVLEPFTVKGETRYRIVGVDNDHAFVRPFAAKSQGQRLQKDLQVKTILYCLDNMQAPIHPKTCQALLALDVAAFLQQWLDTLEQREQQHEAIFGNKTQQPAAIQKAIGIAFRPSIVRDLYQKLSRLQVALQRHPTLSHFELLRRVIPELGVCYLAAFQHSANPHSRFEQLTETLYERVMIQGTSQQRTLTNAVQILAMTQDLTEPEEAEADIAAVRQRLQAMQQSRAQLCAIRDEVQAGNLKRFFALSSLDQQAAIINGQGAELPGLDFSAMTLADGQPDLKRQRAVLNALRTLSLRNLRLHGCAVVTDQDIALWLKKSPELRALSLSACPRLTDEALYLIAELCPQIEKLKLSQLNLQQPGNQLDLLWLGIFASLPETAQPIVLPALRELQITDCAKLTVLKLNAPFLARLYLRHCLQLVQITTASQQLNALDLRGCSALTDVVMPTLVRAWQQVSWVKVSGTALQAQCWRERYPALNDLAWQEYPEAEIAKLDQALTQALQQRQLQLTPALSQLFKPLLAALNAIPRLLNALQDKNDEVRRAAAGALKAAVALQHETVIPALLNALQDNDYQVRQAAVEALAAAMPLQPEKVIPALLNALQNKNSEVRQAATEALKAAVPLQPETVIPALLKALQDKEYRVRSAAAQALVAAVPLQPETVIPALLNALQDEYEGVRQAAANVLATAVPLQPETVIPALLNALQDQEARVRSAAATALKAAVPLQPETVIPALLNALQDQEWWVRQAATEALQAAVPLQPETVIPALLNALQDKKDGVRSAATEALQAAVPLQPETVISALLNALQDEEEGVRLAAAGALKAAVALQSEIVIPALLNALQDIEWRVRQGAVEALVAAVALQPESVIPPLLNALQDKELWIRLAAAKALAAVVPLQPDKIIPALLNTLQDKEWLVRLAATKALATAVLLQPETVIPALLHTLQDEKFDVRNAAAKALAAAVPLQPDNVIPPLLDALQDGSYWVRQAASEALQAAVPLQPDNVIPALLNALQDQEARVRLAAATALLSLFKLPATDLVDLLHQLLDRAGYPRLAFAELPAAVENKPTSAMDAVNAVAATAVTPLASSMPVQPVEVIQQQQRWQFTETKVDHDGWCAVNAICQAGIQITGEAFIAALKAELSNATVQQLVSLSLRSCLANTTYTAAQPPAFQTLRQKLTAVDLAEEQRLKLLQKANAALSHQRAEDYLSLAALLQEPRVAKYHAPLQTAEQHWLDCQTALTTALQQACPAYLDFIAQDRYADENLLRAYLFTQQRQLGVVIDYGQGRTAFSQGLDIVNQPAWPMLYIVYRPGKNERTATYDQLTLLQGPVPLAATSATASAASLPGANPPTSAAAASASAVLSSPSAQPLIAEAAPSDDPAQRQLLAQREPAFKELLKNVKRDFKQRQLPAPTVFISYAWEMDSKANQALQARLQQLQADLQSVGMKVYLDITHIDGDMGHYMRQGIEDSDYVLLIGTPRLKQRLENPATNIALGWHCTQAKCQSHPKALIPLLFSGDFNTAFPPGVMQFLIRDFRKPEQYQQRMTQLSDPLGLIPSLYGLHQGEKAAKNYAQFLKLFNLELAQLEKSRAATPVAAASSQSSPGTAATALLQHSVLFAASAPAVSASSVSQPTTTAATAPPSVAPPSPHP